MAKSTTFCNDLLKLIFNATAIASIADNAATPLTNLFVALHTGDPTAGGNQSSAEGTVYTGYGRVAVPRASGAGGFTVTANAVSPQASITFPAGTAGSGLVTHFSIGTQTTGNPGKILYSGTVTPNISVGSGVTPILTNLSTVTET
jgi:hypothetical protein